MVKKCMFALILGIYYVKIILSVKNQSTVTYLGYHKGKY